MDIRLELMSAQVSVCKEATPVLREGGIQCVIYGKSSSLTWYATCTHSKAIFKRDCMPTHASVIYEVINAAGDLRQHVGPYTHSMCMWALISTNSKPLTNRADPLKLCMRWWSKKHTLKTTLSFSMTKTLNCTKTPCSEVSKPTNCSPTPLIDEWYLGAPPTNSLMIKWSIDEVSLSPTHNVGIYRTHRAIQKICKSGEIMGKQLTSKINTLRVQTLQKEVWPIMTQQWPVKADSWREHRRQFYVCANGWVWQNQPWRVRARNGSRF